MKKAEKFKRIREDLSIIEYASRSGFTLVRKGKYYSLKEHDSVMIDPVKNVYWQNSKMGYGKCIGKEGSIIDFAVNFNRMSMYEAIREFEQMLGIPGKTKVYAKKKKGRINRAKTGRGYTTKKRCKHEKNICLSY